VVPGVGFEWIRTLLPAGCDGGTFPAYAPGSHEFVVVESGRLRLTVGGEAVDLGPGDSVYFAADAPAPPAPDLRLRPKLRSSGRHMRSQERNLGGLRSGVPQAGLRTQSAWSRS
jgi:hypothetical protein